MATVIPQEPLSTSAAELKVRAALATLDDGWTVLHGVAWQGIRSGRPADGEADFVLVRPGHGIIVVEVKGGGVELEQGAWFSTDRHGARHKIKDPYLQAVQSKHSLLAHLQGQGVLDRFVPFGHVVALPDIAQAPVLGPAGPSEITWTDRDVRSISAAVQAVVDHWELRCELSGAESAAIVSALAPTISVRPLLREQVAVSLDRQLELTAEQVGALQGLRRNRRTLIYGGAGTGKTVLAVERARQIAADGSRVLLTCFNRPLGDHLAEVTAEDPLITAGSFHSFAFGQAKNAGELLPTSPNADWYDDELPSLLPQAAAANGTAFDALVIDEAQDFAPMWWTSLALLLEDPDNGPFHLFLDSNQSIYRSDWEAPFDGASFDLSINCRSSVPILERVAFLTDGAAPPSRGAPGPDPRFEPIESFGDVGAALRRSLHRLLVEERLSASQLTILSTSKDVVEELRARKVGPHLICKPGQSGIVAETVHRFKGLESDAVVLIVPEVSADTERLLYVGVTRARAYLEAIAVPEPARLLGWQA